MKALTIENKWFVTMISQMFAAQKNHKNIQFQLRTEDQEEQIISPYYNSSLSNYPIYNVNPILGLDCYFKKQNDDYYSFSTKFFEHNVISYESNLMEKLQILSLKESQDSIMICHNLMDDEYCFKTVFDSLTDHRFLQYNIRYLLFDLIS